MRKNSISDPINIGAEDNEVKKIKMRRRMEYFQRRIMPDFSPLKTDGLSP
jgi:hypothetical protein